MCLFSSPKVPDAPRTPAPVVRREESPLSRIFARRRNNARGTFGNIHTSPTGVTERAQTTATTLGTGGAVVI